MHGEIAGAVQENPPIPQRIPEAAVVSTIHDPQRPMCPLYPAVTALNRRHTRNRTTTEPALPSSQHGGVRGLTLP